MISAIISKRLERSPRNVMKVLAAVDDARQAADDYVSCVDGIDGDECGKSKVKSEAVAEAALYDCGSYAALLYNRGLSNRA